jgi:hypothetical protein
MTLNCKLCNRKVTWPHECFVELGVKHRKYYLCKHGCGGKIYFDKKMKTSDRILVPISAVTGFPHQCGDKYHW